LAVFSKWNPHVKFYDMQNKICCLRFDKLNVEYQKICTIFILNRQMSNLNYKILIFFLIYLIFNFFLNIYTYFYHSNSQNIFEIFKTEGFLDYIYKIFNFCYI